MQKIEAKIIKPASYSFGGRVETGAVEFTYSEKEEDPKDWPGVFIRGDNALMTYAPALEHILEHVVIDPKNMIDVLHLSACKGLVDLLRECAVKPSGENNEED